MTDVTVNICLCVCVSATDLWPVHGVSLSFAQCMLG